MSGDEGAVISEAEASGGGFSGPAWYYKIPAAFGNAEGELKLSGGRLTFTTAGKVASSMAKHLEEQTGRAGLAETMEAGGATTILDAAVDELAIRFPVLAFGATMQVRSGETLYRFAFYNPSTGLQGMLRRGITNGRPWKAALA